MWVLCDFSHCFSFACGSVRRSWFFWCEGREWKQTSDAVALGRATVAAPSTGEGAEVADLL